MIRSLHLGFWCGLVLCSTIAQATNWVVLKNPDKTVQHAYDRDRLRVDGSVVVFWRRVLFLKPQSGPYGEVYKGVYQERIDCQNQTLQTLYIGLYQKDYRVLFEKGAAEVSPANTILPESIGELFQTAMCRFVHTSAFAPLILPGQKVKTPLGKGTFVPHRRPVVINGSLPLMTPIDSFAPTTEATNSGLISGPTSPRPPTAPSMPDPRTSIPAPMIVPPLFSTE